MSGSRWVWATSATAGNVEDFDAGLPSVSANTKRVSGVMAASNSSGRRGIDEGGDDTEARQREVEHVVGAAVDVAAGHDVAAGTHKGGHGQEERRPWPLAVATAPTPPSRAATRSSSTATGVGGEMRGVDVAGDLQVEQAGGVVGVFAGVRRGEVDRHGPGPRSWGRCAGPPCRLSVSKRRKSGSTTAASLGAQGRPEALETARPLGPDASRPSPHRLGGWPMPAGPRVRRGRHPPQGRSSCQPG